MIGLTYEKMRRFMREGFRKGNWHDLKSSEKALFRAAKWCIKKGMMIVARTPLKNLLKVIKKLTSTVKRKIWQKGLEKAYKMRRQFEEKGVFEWCPQARDWLQDMDYIFYLGVSSMNSNGRGFP
ncbi:hypothetical protein AKJ44_01515 [candidate division MSBL1 archaeon SCGC-AAA261F17]|uniref:Uncharacterized protein n=1 Tax=candidate division MSBL1 archaeon SCGC-AAA261F17 TaxID=1698274 RepID=A0A133V6H7_9EURY|nr:hypothetical protein AKJ44_01515 [candidate division MSBL1 archaeon SCGC-AAA261F17]